MSDLITRITNSVINAENSASLGSAGFTHNRDGNVPLSPVHSEHAGTYSAHKTVEYALPNSIERVICSDDLCNNPIPVQDAHQCHVDRRPFCEHCYPIHVSGETTKAGYIGGEVAVIRVPGCEACQEAKVRQRNKWISILAEIVSIEAGR